jgi:histone H3/H4
MNLKTMKVAELKKLCKERGLKKYSKLRKSELIELLNKSESKHQEPIENKQNDIPKINVEKIVKNVIENTIDVINKNLLIEEENTLIKEIKVLINNVKGRLHDEEEREFVKLITNVKMTLERYTF